MTLFVETYFFTTKALLKSMVGQLLFYITRFPFYFKGKNGKKISY